MLRVENINKSYQIREDKVQVVLKNLSVSFDEVGFVTILGSSGNGKTTLLNIIGGLDNKDSGTIYYHDQEIEDYKVFRRQNIGFVFQEYNLIKHLSIVDNVVMSISDEVKDKEETAKKILSDLGLEEHYHKHPNQLSGGQMQRVAIARMIAKDVKIIICDEPTGNLDVAIEERITDIIKELSKDRLVIFVTHNRELAHKYSDRIIEIEDGKVLKDTGVYTHNGHHDNGVKKSFEKNLFWLATKNLIGRNKESLKIIVFSFVIMALAALSIVLNSGLFKDYMHDVRVSNGLMSMYVTLTDDADYENVISNIENNENVSDAAFTYEPIIRVAGEDYLETRFANFGRGLYIEAIYENCQDNTYINDSITNGRFPVESDEILLTYTGAISLLVELGIGGERLNDQFMTGEMDHDYIWSLMDDKAFIILENEYPRIRVVGLLDDARMYNDEHVVYHIDGFDELIGFEELEPVGITVYKDYLYESNNDDLVTSINNIDDASVNEYHQDVIRVEYNKISSFLQFAEIGLYTVIVIASISYVSLLFSSLSERTYEIGLYRSIGYKSRSIMKTLGLEMLICSVIAAFVVLIILLLFGLFMVFLPYNKMSYIDILMNMNLVTIMLGIAVISVITSLIVIYITNRRNLRKPIIANISEL